MNSIVVFDDFSHKITISYGDDQRYHSTIHIKNNSPEANDNSGINFRTIGFCSERESPEQAVDWITGKGFQIDRLKTIKLLKVISGEEEPISMSLPYIIFNKDRFLVKGKK